MVDLCDTSTPCRGVSKFWIYLFLNAALKVYRKWVVLCSCEGVSSCPVG